MSASTGIDPTATEPPGPGVRSGIPPVVPRGAALTAAVGLTAMAVLAPWASATVPARGALIGFAVVAVLDLIVAWGLWDVFRPVHARLSAAQGIVRVAYTLVLAACLIPLGRGDAGGFRFWWESGLALFGVHLLLVAAVLWLHPRSPRWLAVLVAVGGVGYLVDGVATVSGWTGPKLSVVTFVGEVIMIVWLYRLAARGGRAATGRTN